MSQPQAAIADRVDRPLLSIRAARLHPLMSCLLRTSQRTWILAALGLLGALATDGLFQRLFSAEAPQWPHWLRLVTLLLPAGILVLILRVLCLAPSPQPASSALLLPQDLRRGLHDQLGHSLVLARLQVDQLLSHTPGALHAKTLMRLSEHLNESINWVRRALSEHAPARCADRPLSDSLADLLENLAPLPEGMQLSLNTDPQANGLRWPIAVETAATLVAREALLNALRHAQGSRITIELGGNKGCLRLAVQDNGIGMPPELERTRPGHFGLAGMHDNARAVGAHLTLSCLDAGGTRVAFVWRG